MTETDTLTEPDPEAPFGRRPNGVAYKRDPSAFAHLRGKAFGSMNGNPKAPTPRGAAKASKPRASATPKAPPKLDAAGYAKKFQNGFMGLAKFVSRKAPDAGIILAVRSEDMSEPWGRVAVSYPRVGRAVDVLTKGGDLGDAVGSTVLTVGMIALSMGLLKDTPLGDLLEEAVIETMQTFAESDEFAKMRDKMQQRANRVVRVVATVDGDAN
jgi:hypothetical protein